MGKLRDYLMQMYRVNPESQAFILDIDLEKYAEVFNEWDRAPFNKKALEPELLAFIDDCSEDIPMRYKLEFCFHLPKIKKDKRKEIAIIAGLRNYFDFNIHLLKEERFNENKKVALYIIIAFSFLFSFSFFSKKINNHAILSIMLEGLMIGGWVFLWEAFSSFFFTKNEIGKKVNIFRRYYNAKIEFIYE